MIIYAILIILLLIVIKRKSFEKFSNKYDKKNVTVSKFLSYNPTIIYLDDPIYIHISDILSRFNPFDRM